MSRGRAPIPPRLGAAAGSRAVLVVCLLALAGGVVLFCFDPGRYSFYPFCVFHRTTGLLCPGCGGLRATHQLLHGHLATALHFNALFVLALPVAAWFVVRFALGSLRNQPPTPAIRPVWLWCALVATLLFGVARNFPFAHVAWLAP